MNDTQEAPNNNGSLTASDIMRSLLPGYKSQQTSADKPSPAKNQKQQIPQAKPMETEIKKEAPKSGSTADGIIKALLGIVTKKPAAAETAQWGKKKPKSTTPKTSKTAAHPLKVQKKSSGFNIIEFSKYCRGLGVKCGSYKTAIILEKDDIRYQVFQVRGIATKIVRKENKKLIEVPIPTETKNDVYAIAKYISAHPIEIPPDEPIEFEGLTQMSRAIDRTSLVSLHDTYQLDQIEIPPEAEVVPGEGSKPIIVLRKAETMAGIFRKKIYRKPDDGDAKAKPKALEGLPEKALFLGGHITLVNKVKQLHPGWTFLTDDEFIRGWGNKLNFMYVFYWTAHSSHSMKEYTEARLNPDAKIIYITATNLKLLEQEMLQGFKQVQENSEGNEE